MRARINCDTEPDVRVITHLAQQDFVSYVQVFMPFYFSIRRPKNKSEEKEVYCRSLLSLKYKRQSDLKGIKIRHLGFPNNKNAFCSVVLRYLWTGTFLSPNRTCYT